MIFSGMKRIGQVTLRTTRSGYADAQEVKNCQAKRSGRLKRSDATNREAAQSAAIRRLTFNFKCHFLPNSTVWFL